MMAATTRHAIEALEDTLRAWRMVHHAPTSRLQEQGRETLEEARLLLEAPTAKDAAKAVIMIGEVAEFCDEDVLGAVKCAERAARDVVVVCCG